MAINTICETWTMDHGAKRTEQGRASKAQGGASEVSGDSPPDKGRDSVCEADCDCESAWSVESLPSVAQISAGRIHTACVAKEGKVFAWGCAANGRLGVVDTSSMPVDEELNSGTMCGVPKWPPFQYKKCRRPLFDVLE